jgi:predicted HAD superfamily Cof-like phosphohydrolase
MDKNHLALVDFEKQFGTDTTPSRPFIPDRELTALRGRLIREEADELLYELSLLALCRTEEALVRQLAKVAKEAADLKYVIYGTEVRLGLDGEPVFDAVHQSNMTKAGGPRRSDGKLLKPEGWQAPDIESIIRRQLNGEVEQQKTTEAFVGAPSLL